VITTRLSLAVGVDALKIIMNFIIKKLGSHHQMMILNASTVDMNLPVTVPIPSLLEFLDQKT
jgi:hypothetical protein